MIIRQCANCKYNYDECSKRQKGSIFPCCNFWEPIAKNEDKKK
jgi:hypothetical protein